MNLNGSIREIQNKIQQRYLKLEQRFSGNTLIRETWAAMAGDISQQIRSMGALPQSFWNQLKKNQDAMVKGVKEGAAHQDLANEGDQALKDCFELALRWEEPVILKIYAPLIRKLRENSTAPALDFYIIVKAHLARITRVVQSFSGDPGIIQRANALQQAFEKEVQEPQVVVLIKQKKPRANPVVVKEKAKKAIRKSPVKARSAAKHPQKLHRRVKPLAKKVSMPRSRAHR